ncbi:Pr6Pr family membrane protein [Kocuria turfanensis]|uniref:Pr6Pr family membrane protein n=1 Tax=Kocuria turfanensis TaxID=388357 RepID=UPI00403739EC
MRAVVVAARVSALVVAVWALVSRADCAFVTRTCLGSNLFSYFTVHSAFLLIVALLLAVLHTATGRPEPGWLTGLRALATTYTTVSGAVFAVLLANAELFGHLFLVPLSSKVLHFVLPVYALLDFLLAPGRNRLRWATTWVATVFPALWAVYTLVRGRMVGWYPYFFLDPALVGGYGAVGTYALGLSVLILAVAFLSVAATRLPAVPAGPGPDRPRRDRPAEAPRRAGRRRPGAPPAEDAGPAAPVVRDPSAAAPGPGGSGVVAPGSPAPEPLASEAGEPSPGTGR